MRSISISVMSLVLAAAGSLAVFEAPAVAAVDCQDDGCTGKLPEVQGCDVNATTGYTKYAYSQDLWFDERISVACDSTWGRIRDDRPNNFCDSSWAVRVQSRRWVDSANDFVMVATEKVQQTSSTNCFGHVVWSRMIGTQGTSERLQYGRVTSPSNVDWSGGSGWQ